MFNKGDKAILKYKTNSDKWEEGEVIVDGRYNNFYGKGIDGILVINLDGKKIITFEDGLTKL